MKGKKLLSIVLGINLNKLKIVPQKVYPGADTDLHGARTLFLYTKGTKGIPSQSLKEFLHYMEHSTEENACNDILKDIHRMVAKVKQDKEVSLEYMKVFEQQKLIYEQGIEQGVQQGLRQGVQQGSELTLIRQVCKKLEKNCSVPDIADMLETDEPTIQAICDTAKTFAPDYDAEKILAALPPESETSD